MPQYYLLPKKMMERFAWAQAPVWFLEAALFYLLLGVARLLPLPAASALFSRLLGVVGYRNWKKRRAVGRNMDVMLSHAGQPDRERLMRQVFRSTGLAAAELFLLDRIWRDRKLRLEFSLHPEAETVIARKEAIVFATAHVGAWQLTPLIGRQYDLSISVLYAPERNPWLHRFFLARRQAFGGRLVPSVGGSRDFLRELTAGRSVGAAFDTRVDEGQMVPFFGIPTPSNTLPAMLALRGYTVIPIRAKRLPDCRYRIEAMAPLVPADPAAPRTAQILDLTGQLNDLFEDWIREDPGQWICMKRRWPKKRPAKRSRNG